MKTETASTKSALAEWKLQDAKTELSELVRRAQTQPQKINLEGRGSVFVISADAYSKIEKRRPHEEYHRVIP